MRAHHWRTALVGLGLVLSLSSCDSNPTPAPLPTRSSSPSQSQTPTPPALPEAARGTSSAAAKAFVEYWIAALNYAGHTGEIDELRRVSATKCRACNGYIKAIRTTYASGGRFEGGEWRVTSAEAFSTGGQSEFAVALTVEIAEQVSQPDERSPEETTSPSTNTGDFIVSRTPRGWQMMRIAGHSS